MTYSIVALDPATGDLGVAVQTRWFNGGAFDELGRLLGLARGYDAMDEAERAFSAGDSATAAVARARSIALSPDHDQVVLWSAVGLAVEGRIDEAREALARATAVEPRSGEHLRRFCEAGHLPGGEETLRALGLA